MEGVHAPPHDRADGPGLRAPARPDQLGVDALRHRVRDRVRLRGAADRPAVLDAVKPNRERMAEILESGRTPWRPSRCTYCCPWPGTPTAHEKARVVARQARVQHKPLTQVIREDHSLDEYLQRLAAPEEAGAGRPLPLHRGRHINGLLRSAKSGRSGWPPWGPLAAASNSTRRPRGAGPGPGRASFASRYLLLNRRQARRSLVRRLEQPQSFRQRRVFRAGHSSFPPRREQVPQHLRGLLLLAVLDQRLGRLQVAPARRGRTRKPFFTNSGMDG